MPDLAQEIQSLRNESDNLRKAGEFLQRASEQLEQVASHLDDGDSGSAEQILVRVVRDLMAVGGIWYGPFVQLAANLAKFSNTKRFQGDSRTFDEWPGVVH